MPGASIVGNRMFFDGMDVCEIAEEYDTPVLLYSERIIRENIRVLRKAFSSTFSLFRIKYAMKANYNPTILNIVREEGCDIDASSLNEIKLAIKCGFDPQSILFTANNASKEELQEAVDIGVVVNFDSIGQFRQLNGNLPSTISFRTKIEYGKGEFKGMTTSGPGAKFGLMPQEVEQAYREARDSGVANFGIHVFAGSNIRDPAHFGTVTDSALAIATEIEQKLGIKFSFLDIGGGYGVPYLPGDSAIDLTSTVQAIHDSFHSHFKNHELPTLYIEPGRFVVANSAILIGTVRDVKKQELNYLGTDIGMNLLLRPALYGAKHHIVLCNKGSSEVTEKYEVVGQICENTDRIGSSVSLPQAEVGDIIAVFNAGAYVIGMASRYNGRLLPSEVLIHGKKTRIIRERDTFDDFVRHFTDLS